MLIQWLECAWETSGSVKASKIYCHILLSIVYCYFHKLLFFTCVYECALIIIINTAENSENAGASYENNIIIFHISVIIIKFIRVFQSLHSMYLRTDNLRNQPHGACSPGH